VKIGNPSLTQIEKRFLLTAIENGDISQGSYIDQFEKEWAHLNGREFGVSCNSGTSAIKLALQAIGIGEYDEVIVPEFTMAACAFSVSSLGASPVFVDCLDDLTMDVDKIKVTENTKAILIVPIYGRPVSDSVYKFARKNGLKIIEDFAEGHGIKPKGDITCYSFQANKIITTGEGGMCITNNGPLANEMRKLAALYFDEKRSMIHNRVSQNYRMTNLQAAIGLGQIRRFEELKNKRIKIAEWYDEYLPKEMERMPKREVVWVYDIQTDHQEKLKSFLNEKGIETRYGFKPMSEQPMYQHPSNDWKKLNAYKWSRRILYLPTYYDMNFIDVKKVCQTIQRYLDTK